MSTATAEVPSPERVDVVVVGARIAGNAAAIPLARRGRRVLVLDSAAFPSDTVSTHVMFPGGLAELKRLGALDRVLAAGAPPCPRINLGADGVQVYGTYREVDGIDFGLCTRRPELDMALVTTAREAGAEVRERCKVVDLVWHGGRAGGVRYRDADGVEHLVHARLVIGADGRDSVVAHLVGSTRYRTMPNGRGLAFHYVTDGAAGRGAAPERTVLAKWQHGTTSSFFFPSNNDSAVALFMPPVEEITRFRGDAAGTWDRLMGEAPELSARLAGSEKETRLRAAEDTEGFFRVSAGPGWALVGDAGHFKDPVIAQGIREALRTGRLLGEAVAGLLEDPVRLDRTTRACERARDLDVLPTFYWGYKHSRAGAVSAVEAEFYEQGRTDPQIGRDLADTFSRAISPQQLVSIRRELVWTWRALRRPGADRRAIARFVVGELRLDAAMVRDKARVLAGGRPRGHARNRWARDGWTPRMALAEHRVVAERPAPAPTPEPLRPVRSVRATRNRASTAGSETTAASA